MKSSRREFLASSLALALSGCSNLLQKPSGSGGEAGMASRRPSALGTLGYRLSKPISGLKNHYTAVVIGSGYGASVLAARLSARYGDLCLLERGKEWHPGDFPETQEQLVSALKGPGNPLGLIDVAPGRDLEIVSGNGLGGTSLINAAIAIRPEFNVFEQSVWPTEIAQDAKSGQLENFYQLAESILQPNRLNQIRFAKSQLHKINSTLAKREWDELNLNIRNDSFGTTTRPNEFGYPQAPCTQCGNCCSGCNFGAKNTLLTNYLYMAYKKGAEIFTQVEVENIEKKDSKYVLNLKITNSFFGLPVRKKISADLVFLGAGAKGSTEILMRSQCEKFDFSAALGTRLSANGDVMGLSYNTDQQTNITASAQVNLKLGKGNQGAIISSYANFRAPSLNNDVMSQFLLLDGIVPSALSDTVARVLASYALINKTSMYASLSAKDRDQKIIRIKKDCLGSSEEGALNHSMLYFACGHDSSGGKFIYDRESNSFDYQWKDVLNEPTFKRIESVMRQFTAQNGGTFFANPRTTIFGQKVQATHPLGGCPMGQNVATGVVNHLGQVYDPKGGFHKNFYVMDASVIPHSLSATPLLTITALAERTASAILKS